MGKGRTVEGRTAGRASVNEPGFDRIALAYPASLIVPAAGFAVVGGNVLRASMGSARLVAMFAAGLALWTLVEYVLHRYLLHGVEPFRRWHMAHHLDADLPIRIPLPFSLVLVLALIGLPSVLVWNKALASALSAGLLLGHLAQEVVHHRLHRNEDGGGWWAAQRRHHRHHHFNDPERAFGTLTAFWDRMFGTLPRP